jgi:hypothetical protein
MASRGSDWTNSSPALLSTARIIDSTHCRWCVLYHGAGHGMPPRGHPSCSAREQLVPAAEHRDREGKTMTPSIPAAPALPTRDVAGTFVHGFTVGSDTWNEFPALLTGDPDLAACGFDFWKYPTDLNLSGSEPGLRSGLEPRPVPPAVEHDRPAGRRHSWASGKSSAGRANPGPVRQHQTGHLTGSAGSFPEYLRASQGDGYPSEQQERPRRYLKDNSSGDGASLPCADAIEQELGNKVGD